MAKERARTLFRHGFVILFIAFSLGLVVGATENTAKARLWLGAHTTGIMVGLLLVALGAVWPHLRLGVLAEKVAWFCAIVGNWTGVLVLGLFAPAVSFPSRFTPLPDIAKSKAAVVGSGIVVVSITTLLLMVLVIIGLRGRAEE